MEHLESFIDNLEETIRENIKFPPRITPPSEQTREDILEKLREWYQTDDLEIINESLANPEEYQNTWETIGIDIYDDYAKKPEEYEAEKGDAEYEMRRGNVSEATYRVSRALTVVSQDREDFREDWSPSGPDPEWEDEQFEPGHDPGPGDSLVADVTYLLEDAIKRLPRRMNPAERQEAVSDAQASLEYLTKKDYMNAAKYGKRAFELVESIMYEDFPDQSQPIVDAWYEYYVILAGLAEPDDY